LVNKLSSQYNCSTRSKDNSGGGEVKPVGYVDNQGKLTQSGAQFFGSLEWPLLPTQIDMKKMERFAEGYAKITNDISNANKLKSFARDTQNIYKVNNQRLDVDTAIDVDRFIYERTEPKRRAQGYIQSLYALIQQSDYMINVLESILRQSEGSLAIDPLLEKAKEQKQYYNQNLFHINKWQVEIEDYYRDLMKKR
jgi:uncharacterized membrane protein YgaE (UPF0421/DUF939 family)